jgi:hypothetical protein
METVTPRITFAPLPPDALPLGAEPAAEALDPDLAQALDRGFLVCPSPRLRLLPTSYLRWCRRRNLVGIVVWPDGKLLVALPPSLRCRRDVDGQPVLSVRAAHFEDQVMQAIAPVGVPGTLATIAPGRLIACQVPAGKAGEFIAAMIAETAAEALSQ